MDDPARGLDADRVRRALAMLVVGVVVLLADLRINGFDLVNDLVGILLVAAAVVSLTDLPAAADRHREVLLARVSVLVAVPAIAYLEVLQPLATLSAGPAGPDPPLSEAVLGLLPIWAAVLGLFALARVLAHVAARHDLPSSATNWSRTAWIAVVGYVVPVGTAEILVVLALATGGAILRLGVLLPIIIGAAVLLALLPGIATVWSALAMGREMGRGGAAGAAG